MVYDFPVEEDKVKPEQVTALHLVCAFAFIVAGAIITVYNYTIPKYGAALLFTGVVLLALAIIKNKWLTRKKVSFIFRIAEFLVSGWIAIYSVAQGWKFPIVIFTFLTGAILFAIYWERAAGGALFIYIDEEGIKLPVSSRKRFIPWTEIEQVTFRFGTLSVDCIDNHLFQWNISVPDIDQGLFESWCIARVDENRDKRRKDDW